MNRRKSLHVNQYHSFWLMQSPSFCYIAVAIITKTHCHPKPKKKKRILVEHGDGGHFTVCICNISSASEDGDNNNAHDHQKPVNYRDVNLAHELSWGVNYLEPGKAPQSHRLLYAWKCSRYHCLASNHSSKCGYHKHWPEETAWFTQSTT